MDDADRQAAALLKSGDQVTLAQLLRNYHALQFEVVGLRAQVAMEKSRLPGEKH